jgi:GH25 family lysozyme M1 (1,4-beta-N-acetylmuramidase)
MGIYGQDWASYQSATPSTSGLSFVFVKVAEGLSYINPLWAQQRDHAKAKGLVWGAYYYPHMANSPQAEADYFLSQVAWQPGDLVVLDWEGYDPANTGVAKSTQASYKDAWLRYVKSRLPNNRVGVYANVDYWRNVDRSGYCGDFLWIATAGRNAGDPGISDPWLFHQYSEAGGLDRDYCHLATAADLRAWALSTTTQEDTMATPQEIADAVWSHTEKPGTGNPVRTGAAITWMDSVHSGQNTRLDALAKQVTDLTAKVDSLTTTGLTPEQITAIATKVADILHDRLAN